MQFSTIMYFMCIVFQTNNVFSLHDDRSLFSVNGCFEASSLSVPDISTTETIPDKQTIDLLQAVAALNNTSVTTTKGALMQLNEISQYNNIQYEFTFVGEKGPAHNKIFQVQLTLGNEVYEAEGKSKKSARQLAASYALELTSYKLPTLASISNDEIKNLNTPTVQLNNIAQKLALKVSYESVDKSSLPHSHSEHSYDGKPKSVLLQLNHTFDDELFVDNQNGRHPYIYKVIVGEKEYYGIGNSAQEAKHEAAKSALNSMKQEALEEYNFCAHEEYEEECQLKKMSLKSPISKVYETAQKLKVDVSFTIIKEIGKDHKKIFIMECKLGDLAVTAEGKSKKEAKRAVAELMLERVNELPDTQSDDYSIILKNKNKKKKSKKSPNKIVNGIKSFGESAVKGLSSFWDNFPELNIGGSTNEVSVQKENDEKSNSKHQPQKQTFKSTILHLSNTFNVHIDYKNLGKKDNHFYSQLSLDTKPKYVCFGKGDSLQDAENIASLRGVRLLQKLGFNMKNVIAEEVIDDKDVVDVEDVKFLWVRTKSVEEEKS